MDTFILFCLNCGDVILVFVILLSLVWLLVVETTSYTLGVVQSSLLNQVSKMHACRLCFDKKEKNNGNNSIHYISCWCHFKYETSLEGLWTVVPVVLYLWMSQNKSFMIKDSVVKLVFFGHEAQLFVDTGGQRWLQLIGMKSIQSIAV